MLGRPFYLMGFVDGWSPMDHARQVARAVRHRPRTRGQGLVYQLAEGIALLSKVDWKAKGLHDLGRPDGFHERQVDRWIGFFERIKGREIDGLDVATEWLRTHKPLDFIPGLMHGDYQFANVMYHHGAPAQLAAIVDWEMGTVGDPKLDLGWMVQSWPEDTERRRGRRMSYVDMRGMPSRDEVVEHYAKVSGRQVDDLDYYLVLAKWKLAIVLEQGFQRAGDDEKLLAFGPVVARPDGVGGRARRVHRLRGLTCAPRSARHTGRRRSSASTSVRRRRSSAGQVGCGSAPPRSTIPDVLLDRQPVSGQRAAAVRARQRVRRRHRRNRRRGSRFRRRRPGDRHRHVRRLRRGGRGDCRRA